MVDEPTQDFFPSGFVDVFRHKQILVATVTNQSNGLAYTLLHFLRDKAQHRVACVVTVHVVIDLEVVKVHHCHTDIVANVIFERFLVIAAVICARKHVHIYTVEVLATVRAPFEFVGGLANFADFLYKLHYVRFSVGFHVACNDLVCAIVGNFDFFKLLLLSIRFEYDTVVARLVVFPKTVTIAIAQRNVAFYAAHLFVQRLLVQYAYHVKYF